MPSAAEMVEPRAGLWDFLASHLRFHRTKQGKSLAEVGVIVGTDRRTVGDWESRRSHPPAAAMRALDTAWDTGGVLELLYHYAQTLPDKADWYGDYLSIERQARQLKIYQGQVIPALVQTEAYMCAVLTEAGVSDVDAAIRERMERQAAVLRREDPPWTVLLLDECVLRRPAGGPEVMRDQFAALVELGQLNHVMVRVIPESAGTHVGLDGSFTYLITDTFDLVLVATPDANNRMVQGRDELAKYLVRYDRIGSKAMTPDDSRSMIRHMMEAIS